MGTWCLIPILIFHMFIFVQTQHYKLFFVHPSRYSRKESRPTYKPTLVIVYFYLWWLIYVNISHMSQTVICQIQPYAAFKNPDVGFMFGLSCSIVVENSFKTMKAAAWFSILINFGVYHIIIIAHITHIYTYLYTHMCILYVYTHPFTVQVVSPLQNL